MNSPEEGTMITKKTAADTGRRLATVALAGAAMTIPMVSVPAMAAPAPTPGVVRTDHDYGCDDSYDLGGIDRWQGDRWDTDKCGGWGVKHLFPPGWGFFPPGWGIPPGWGSNNFFPKGWGSD
ncbi:hypothetical protein ACWEO2_11615 [Nocardia sp. NPDC004278]